MATKLKRDGLALEPPKKRKMPDMTGVPGEVVSVEGLALVFGSSGRKSPYDPLLDELAAAGAGKVLRFADARARVAVGARAKKKGLRISFAELEGALYVRLDGHADDDVRATRRDRIRRCLKATGGATKFQLAKALLEQGDTTVDAQLIESILASMQRATEVIQAEGGVWRLNPASRSKGGVTT